MNPKREIFFDAITCLPEEIVEEAQGYVFRTSRAAWKKAGSLAACMVLAVSLAFLAAVPRGCGGSAPGLNSSAPASGESAPSDGAMPDYDLPFPGEAPQKPEGVYDGAETGMVQFNAKVLEILDAGTKPSILVEPLEGEDERNSADRIVVSADGEIPSLAVGDLVRITYDGTIMESYPARISGAQAVEKIDG